MKQRAFVRYTKSGRIVPGSMIITQGSYPDGPAVWAEISTDLCCDDPLFIQTTVQKGFIRYTKEGKIVPGSLVLSKKYPRGGGLWRAVTINTCCVPPIVAMRNFLDVDTPGYPVGVWNVNDVYLGTAETQDAAATLWNSDPANQAIGQISSGPTPSTFYFGGVTPPVQIRCLRYYRYTGPSGLEIFVGLNDIVKYGSTTRIAATDATAVNSDTRLEWNRSLWTANYNIKIPNTTVYVLTCTGNPDSTPIFVFHNEDTLYVGTKFFPPNGGVYSFSGALPLATRGTSLRTSFNVNYNDINNWSELTSLWSVCNFSAGGGIWVQNDPTKWPSTMNTSQITQVKIGQASNSPTTRVSDVAPYMTQANYPNVTELLYDSFGPGFAGVEGWFLTIPKVTRYLYVESGTNSTAVSDLVWNNIATNLTGIVPVVGSQARLRVRTTIAVSAASLTSRTYLAAQGWTVSLS